MSYVLCLVSCVLCLVSCVLVLGSWFLVLGPDLKITIHKSANLMIVSEPF